MDRDIRWVSREDRRDFAMRGSLSLPNVQPIPVQVTNASHDGCEVRLKAPLQIDETVIPAAMACDLSRTK